MIQIILIVIAVATILSGLPVQASDFIDIAQGSHPAMTNDNAHNIHLVFEGYESSDRKEILYSQSLDFGCYWSPPLNISKTDKVSSTPAIAVEPSGAIDVVWRDTTSGDLHPDIYFTRSVDNGKTWTEALDISHSTGICSEPSIATASDNSIHVVWVDTRPRDGRPDIFYSYSCDGKNWSACESISPTPGISSEPTIIACHDSIVHCAWLDTTSGEERPDIFYVRKVNKVWTPPFNVSNSPRISDHPSLACGSKGKIFLCWSDNSQKVNAADIWCVIGKNGKFEKPINMSDTPGVSSQPIVVANETDRAAVLWSDTSLKRSKPDIYARASTDNGDDFSNVIDLTNTAGLSRHPAASLIDTKLVVVWEDTYGSISTIKTTTVEIKNIATGPVNQVNPTIHKLNRQ